MGGGAIGRWRVSRHIHGQRMTMRTDVLQYCIISIVLYMLLMSLVSSLPILILMINMQYPA